MMPEPGDPRSSCSPAIYHMTAARGLGAWWKRSEERLPAPLSLAPPQLGEVEPGGGGEEKPCEGEILFQNTGPGKDARAGRPPPPPRPPGPPTAPLPPAPFPGPAPLPVPRGHPGEGASGRSWDPDSGELRPLGAANSLCLKSRAKPSTKLGETRGKGCVFLPKSLRAPHAPRPRCAEGTGRTTLPAPGRGVLRSAAADRAETSERCDLRCASPDSALRARAACGAERATGKGAPRAAAEVEGNPASPGGHRSPVIGMLLP